MNVDRVVLAAANAAVAAHGWNVIETRVVVLVIKRSLDLVSQVSHVLVQIKVAEGRIVRINNAKLVAFQRCNHTASDGSLPILCIPFVTTKHHSSLILADALANEYASPEKNG